MCSVGIAGAGVEGRCRPSVVGHDHHPGGAAQGLVVADRGADRREALAVPAAAEDRLGRRALRDRRVHRAGDVEVTERGAGPAHLRDDREPAARARRSLGAPRSPGAACAPGAANFLSPPAGVGGERAPRCPRRAEPPHGFPVDSGQGPLERGPAALLGGLLGRAVQRAAVATCVGT
jgi:hypothetical protein